MTPQQKQSRYERIITQLHDLLKATDDPVSRMATIASLLNHKMGHFYWIGFYRLIGNQLLVGPYQGTIACQNLQKNTGVCWACADKNEWIIVPDVNRFPGHIACDSRSKSEVVVPVRNTDGTVTAILDADSDKLDMYDEIDAECLQKIADLIYNHPAN